MLTLIAALAFSFFASTVFAKVETPPPSSLVREAILDTVRSITAAELGAPIEFDVQDFRVLDGWAFVRARPQRPGGIEVSYAYTRYERAWETGAFDDRAVALLHETPSGWLVYAYCFGAADIAWLFWSDIYGAPPELFPERTTGWTIFAPVSCGVMMPAGTPVPAIGEPRQWQTKSMPGWRNTITR